MMLSWYYQPHCIHSIETNISHEVFICGGNIMQKLWYEIKRKLGMMCMTTETESDMS